MTDNGLDTKECFNPQFSSSMNDCPVQKTCETKGNMKALIIALAGVLIFTSCASNSPQAVAEKPPRFSDKVEVLVYDDTSRPKTTHLDIYEDKQPEKAFKVIALITCDGDPKDEADAVTAIFYRARQLGAQGVMSAATVSTEKSDPLYIGRGWGFGGGSGTRSVFRAKAIVYEDK
jgi:hypothetical protein